MKKLLSILLLALVLMGTSAFAYQYYARGPMMGSNYNYQTQSGFEKGQFQVQMHQVLENGTYEDLVALREELGFDVARRVQSQEDFIEMQQRHQYMISNGYEPGSMMGQRGSNRGSGGCHAFN